MARPGRLDGQAWRKASKSFQIALANASAQVSDYAVYVLDVDADLFLMDIGSTGGDLGSIPVYTGNLLDSIGVRVLKGNTLMKYRVMTESTYKHAQKPQSMGKIKEIWGDEEIKRRITRPSRRVDKSVVAQLMVGVPYAQEVDWTHDYFESLKDRFVSYVTKHLDRLKSTNFIIE